ncbi:hypothetical protein THAOC_30027, partial [Thalassiosira oceanica]
HSVTAPQVLWPAPWATGTRFSGSMPAMMPSSMSPRESPSTSISFIRDPNDVDRETPLHGGLVQPQYDVGELGRGLRISLVVAGLKDEVVVGVDENLGPSESSPHKDLDPADQIVRLPEVRRLVVPLAPPDPRLVLHSLPTNEGGAETLATRVARQVQGDQEDLLIRLMSGWESSNDKSSPPFVPEVSPFALTKRVSPTKCADTQTVLNRACPPVRLLTVSTSCGMGPSEGRSPWHCKRVGF